MDCWSSWLSALSMRSADRNALGTESHILAASSDNNHSSSKVHPVGESNSEFSSALRPSNPSKNSSNPTLPSSKQPAPLPSSRTSLRQKLDAFKFRPHKHNKPPIRKSHSHHSHHSHHVSESQSKTPSTKLKRPQPAIAKKKKHIKKKKKEKHTDPFVETASPTDALPPSTPTFIPLPFPLTTTSSSKMEYKPELTFATGVSLPYVSDVRAMLPPDFEIHEQLGKGSFNTAHRVRWGGHMRVLRMPRSHSDTRQRGSAKWEFGATHRASQLGCAPTLHAAWYCRHADLDWPAGLYMVMEYFPLNLEHLLEDHSADAVRHADAIGDAVVSVLSTLATERLFVYDLKPSNVVVRFDVEEVSTAPANSAAGATASKANSQPISKAAAKRKKKQRAAQPTVRTVVTVRIIDYGRDFCEWSGLGATAEPDLSTPVTDMLCKLFHREEEGDKDGGRDGGSEARESSRKDRRKKGGAEEARETTTVPPIPPLPSNPSSLHPSHPSRPPSFALLSLPAALALPAPTQLRVSHVLFATMLVQLACTTTRALYDDRHSHKMSAPERAQVNPLAPKCRQFLDSMQGRHIRMLRAVLRHDEVRGVMQHYHGRRNGGTRRTLLFARGESL